MIIKVLSSWGWWNMLEILTLQRLRQEDHEFEATLCST
jgi:hypothetical protein